VRVRDFQKQIEQIYLAKDQARGIDGTFRWFTEEVGELAHAIRHRNKAELAGEFADVFAWLVSLASQSGIDLEAAVADKYRDGCPKCRKTPCACGEEAQAQAQATSRKPVGPTTGRAGRKPQAPS
jgi:NTP pyrophosphatase (non-canonical NTP hydrolase)